MQEVVSTEHLWQTVETYIGSSHIPTQPVLCQLIRDHGRNLDLVEGRPSKDESKNLAKL